MSFRKPECRAFSARAHNLALFLMGAVTLVAFGVLLHSVWVLRP